MPTLRPMRNRWPSNWKSSTTVSISRSASATAVVRLRTVDDQRELVAADARQESAARGRRQALAHLAEQRIAGRMAEHVVDVLEAIEVEAQHRERLGRRGGAFEREVEALVESRPIGQVGERVVIGKMRDAFDRALAVRYVFGDAEQVFGFAVFAVDREPLRHDVANAIVAGLDLLFLDDLQPIGAQHLLVANEEGIGFLLRHEIVVALADQFLAGNAEQLLAGPVHQDVAVLARLLDEQHGGHVFDDGVEKLPGAAQFVICPLPLGDVDEGHHPGRPPLILQELAIGGDVDLAAVRLDVAPDAVSGGVPVVCRDHVAHDVGVVGGPDVEHASSPGTARASSRSARPQPG